MGKGAGVLYWLLHRIVVGPLLKVLFRPWVEGLEHVPASGPAILASNHLSFSDSIFLPILLPRRITFPAKMEYFTGSGVKGRLTRWFFTGVGQIPIDRSGGRASEAAIQGGLRVLRRGELFGIYPEGTRSPDGRLYKGKTGIARMALEADCPVLPVAMIGTDKAQPTGKKVPKIMRIGVRIGAPLDFSRYEGMENDRFVLRSITDEIMYELMLLSGQEYVDVYAGSVKKSALKDTVQTTVQTVVDKAREIQEAAAKATTKVKAATHPEGSETTEASVPSEATEASVRSAHTELTEPVEAIEEGHADAATGVAGPGGAAADGLEPGDLHPEPERRAS